MSPRAQDEIDAELDTAKRVAAMRLEAHLHAYLEALTSVGISQEEAAELYQSQGETRRVRGVSFEAR